MTTIIKRNDILEEIIKYWNHTNGSNIGCGRLKRELVGDSYLLSKQWGRKDIALFNIDESVSINGVSIKISKPWDQLSLEPTGIEYGMNRSKEIIEYIQNWIRANKDEICIQIHFLDWFEKQEIKLMPFDEVVRLLESYEYNQEEAYVLFAGMKY